MPPSDCERALAEAARAGDKAAFAALFLRHRPLLAALCRRTLGDPVLAEDAVQEAALQALLSLASLRQPERFGSWLAGIGLNVCRRWQRERLRAGWSWEALAGGRGVREPVDTQPDIPALVAASEEESEVRRAVSALPPGQRAAVELVYLLGLSHAEAAVRLGTRAGAVKTRLHKARAGLRHTLRTLWEESTVSSQPLSAPVSVRVEQLLRRTQPAGEPPAMEAVVLQEVDGGRRLPIWIGPVEATALARQLHQLPEDRPLTFAFAAGVLQAAGGRLREVRIERLTADTYYAVAVVEGPAGTTEVDARPSDALNLALATGAAVTVQPDVLEIAGVAEPRWDPRHPYPAGEPSARIAGEYEPDTGLRD